MTNKELAVQIFELVGKKSNIISCTHCITRLRFNLKDDEKADVKKIESLDGVLGVQVQGGQFQVILGNKVNKVYAELIEHADIGTEDSGSQTTGEKKKGVISRILETLSSILIPSLPPVIGGGMIKGFLFMFWEFGWIEWGSDVFNLLNIMSDGMFYFYPFLLAVSAAKRFKTNPYMALSLAGVLMHPTIYEGITGGIESFKILGISIPYLDYNASVLPIILAVWIMSYVYRWLEKRIPDIVSIIFTPMLTLIVMVPVTLAFIAPLGYYVGEYIALGAQAIIDLSPILAGFVIGVLRPLTVFTGTHHAVRAIVSQQLATYGYTTIGAMNYMSTMAQAAAPLAVYFIVRKKNKEMRDLSLSSAISGFLGVTEPGLYGVIVKYKIVLIAASIGGGLGAAISSYFGGAEYAMVMSSLVTIPATFGEGFIGIAIGLPVSIISTMAICFAFKNKILEVDMGQNEEHSSGQHTEEEKDNDRILSIASPVRGTVKPIKQVEDETFAKGILGKGIAVIPADGQITSPVDGVVTSLIPSNHAIGFKSDEGIEVLVHAGIDTVKLNGKYFTSYVKEGEHVKKGQKVLEFDIDKVKSEGYSTDVIVVITNTNEYLDVFPNTKLSEASKNDELLRIIV